MSKKTSRRPAHKQAEPAERGEQYFKAGMECITRDDFEGVIQNMTRAIELSPGLGSAYFQRGLAFYLTGRIEQALADLDLSIMLNLETVAGFTEIGQMAGDGLMERMSAPILQEVYEAAVEVASILKENGDYKAAIEAYSQVLDMFDGSASLYFERGHAYFGLGNYMKAITDYSRALRLEPENDLVRYRRALAYRMLNQFDKALEDLAAVEAAIPESGLVPLERGMVLATQGQWADALTQFERSTELDKEYQGVPFLMKLLTEAYLGQTEAALENWEAMIERNPVFAPPQVGAKLREICKFYPVMSPAIDCLIDLLGPDVTDEDRSQ